MKKTLVRVFAAVLCLVLTLGVLPTPAHAAASGSVIPVSRTIYRIDWTGRVTSTRTEYYYVFRSCASSHRSIVDALKSIGADSSYAYRCQIAARNGISGYRGTAAQNIKMLDLLKSGRLIAP